MFFYDLNNNNNNAIFENSKLQNINLQKNNSPLTKIAEEIVNESNLVNQIQENHGKENMLSDYKKEIYNETIKKNDFVSTEIEKKSDIIKENKKKKSIKNLREFYYLNSSLLMLYLFSECKKILPEQLAEHFIMSDLCLIKKNLDINLTLEENLDLSYCNEYANYVINCIKKLNFTLNDLVIIQKNVNLLFIKTNVGMEEYILEEIKSIWNNIDLFVSKEVNDFRKKDFEVYKSKKDIILSFIDNFPYPIIKSSDN